VTGGIASQPRHSIQRPPAFLQPPAGVLSDEGAVALVEAVICQPDAALRREATLLLLDGPAGAPGALAAAACAAAAADDVELLAACQARGAPVEARDRNNETALGRAVQARSFDAAVFLVSQGANCNASLDHGGGGTAWQYAASSQQWPLLERMFAGSTDLRDEGFPSALHEIAWHASTAPLSTLEAGFETGTFQAEDLPLRHRIFGPAEPREGLSLLQIVAMSGNRPWAEALLARGAPLAADDVDCAMMKPAAQSLLRGLLVVAAVPVAAEGEVGDAGGSGAASIA